MAFTAYDVFAPVQRVLQDTDAVRWPFVELADWLTDGLQTIAALKPTAYSQSYVRDLVFGSRQTIPETSTQLFRVVRNITAEAATFVLVDGRPATLDGEFVTLGGGDPDAPLRRMGGKSIVTVDRAMMDAAAPDWHNPAVYPAQDEVDHAVFDEADPRAFYVWPPNNGGGRVETTEGRLPASVWPAGNPDLTIQETWQGVTVDAQDAFRTALVDFVISRSFQKDTRFAGNQARAAAHMAAFAQKIGVKLASVATVNPKATDAAPVPTTQGAE